jgi:hypothetical protein
MTALLQEAVTKASLLPASDQDELAANILAEIEDEERWQATFAASSGLLNQMVEKAKKDVAAGNVRDAG